ncbi:MAG: hypothetical protein JKZ03_04645 [Flavobacteriaceae bacterium]|nr:hypothetical protein [Flavobacteriaceae bacterium]
MKSLPFILIIMLFFTACNNDDDPTSIFISSDEAINALEKTVLDPDTVSNNIIISGATKVTGNPPLPTGNLSFTTSTEEQSGFQSTGVQIKLNTTTPIAGVYLQIVSTDGTKANSFYNIPASAFGDEENSLKQNTNTFSFAKKQFTASNILNTNETTIINVDFSANIPPGTFCGIFCVYDDEGNISEPIEVCVQVESWGGNEALIGTWNLEEITYTETYNGVTETETIRLNEEHCEMESYLCSSTQDEITFEECETITANSVVINGDGTYVYSVTANEIRLDHELFEQDCTVELISSESFFESKGNWAYNEEEGILTIIEFSYTEIFNGITEEEVFEDGQFVFEGKIFSITDNTFVIKDEGSVEINGIIKTYEFSMNFTREE